MKPLDIISFLMVIHENFNSSILSKLKKKLKKIKKNFVD